VHFFARESGGGLPHSKTPPRIRQVLGCGSPLPLSVLGGIASVS